MKLYLLLSLLLCASALHAQDDELLPVEQAFDLSVTATNGDGDSVTATWTIADGYYMYRERFRLASLTPGIELGEPRFPAGKIKEDEFFGKMETYRGQVAVEIPLERGPDAPAEWVLQTVSQGCADLGVCYPPHTQETRIELAELAELAPAAGMGTTPAPSPKSDLLGKLTQTPLGQTDDEQLPPPAQAFIPSVSPRDGNTLRLSWNIDDCCYLYKERFSFTSQTHGITLGQPFFPKGLMEEDEFYGEVEIYRGQVAIDIPMSRASGAPRQLDMLVEFQGCADIGVCYPPQQELIPVILTGLLDSVIPPADAASSPSPPAAQTFSQAPIAEQDILAQKLIDQRFLALPLFLLLGLGLAFTPCVFPMIPILSSIIAGQGENITQSRAFTLSSIYVLAMALTYTVAGVAAALLGQNIQAWFQNPWVLIGFAGIFVLLAMSMFGFYELQVPSRWQSKLNDMSNSQRGGSYTGVAIMGFLSALIVGPCVAPPLIGALTVIGSTGDATLGGAALFTMSLGMGVPLIVIGTSAGKLLPRAGQWMSIVKAVFGVLLLAVAIWMLERILPEVVTMLLWAMLLIVSAVYMGALQGGLSSWRLLSKGLGVVLLVYGVLLLVGVASGGRDALQPLRGVLVAGGGQERHLDFRPIKTVADLEQQLALAGGRPVMLDFYADWCVSCKEMERFTFTDTAVQTALSKAVLLKADVTANDAADQALLQRFGIIGPPAILFFGADGLERPGYRVVGFMSADDFEQRAHLAFQS